MSSPARMTRRRALASGIVGSVSLAFGACGVREARALGRTAYGGRIRMSLPWTFASIDPHDVSDAAAAFFATAITDSLYEVDARGAVTPMLADAMPISDGSGLLVKLRPGLKTAKGSSLDARDVVASLARAKAHGAAPLLGRFGSIQVAPHDGLAIAFSGLRSAGAGEKYSLARALSSPLTAIVPRSFDPRSPDGTGPFSASLSGGELKLARNLNAARGASFLEGVSVAKASDLSASLRAFEAEQDDIGWLGTGLFNARKDAARFDLGRVAWVVLATTSALGEHGAPGGAQTLVDGLPRDRLAHLGLGALPQGKPSSAWDGSPTELLVDRDSPHLVEIAEGVAEILTAPDHEVTTKAVARADIAARRKRGEASLSLGVVRPYGPSTLETLLSLAAFDDPAHAVDIVKSPPKLGAEGARALTSTLRIGVLGELRVFGARLPSLALEAADGGGWDLGASFVVPKKVSP